MSEVATAGQLCYIVVVFGALIALLAVTVREQAREIRRLRAHAAKAHKAGRQAERDDITFTLAQADAQWHRERDLLIEAQRSRGERVA